VLVDGGLVGSGLVKSGLVKTGLVKGVLVLLTMVAGVAASPASARHKPPVPPSPAPGPLAVTISSSDALGTPAPATFTGSSGCGPACPVSFTYQFGASAPVRVKAHRGHWRGGITVTHLGPVTLSVYGTAADGKAGKLATVSVTGTPPAVPYPDGYFTGGYFTGGSHPGLVTVGTGANPSLWLSPGTGNGRVASPIDIGSLGTGINPGRDGPADWTGAIVLHGNFTGAGVQDVMAYYPSGQDRGDGVIIGGAGDASTLLPSPANRWTVTGLSNDPVRLVAAGYASQQAGCIRNHANCVDDLIGIARDGTRARARARVGTRARTRVGTRAGSGSGSGEGLYLYVNGGTPGVYAAPVLLSRSAPDPKDHDWGHYTLATAQLGNNPADTVLFALDPANGTLWESVNPHAGNPKTGPSTVIGTGHWTEITVPWGSSPPTLLQADINHDGATELWTETGATLTAYTLSGTTLTEEATQPYGHVLGDWPLTTGSPYVQGPGTTIATDTVTTVTTGTTGTITTGTTGTTGTITTGNAELSPRGARWISDDYFGTCLGLDQRGYLALPAGTIARSQRDPEISLWFKTSKPDGVLFSLQGARLAPAGRTPGGYDPVLYIGDNGKLYGQWWNGSKRRPLGTSRPVDDGLWHHVVLTASGHDQHLYLDGQQVGTLRGAVDLVGISKNVLHAYLGVGYIGGSWPHEHYYKKHHSRGYTEHFTGEIARVDYSRRSS
jgi:Concanavalin A-like lectin/glucanases superfamily